MKRTLSFMVMALALLLTQCKKPSIDFPTPSETTTVSMTITAGPGSKTDITTVGGIVWSAGDKIYVGDGSKYVGCLAIQSGVGNATGKFTGDVTVATGTHTFHFYYLGSAKDYSKELTTGESASTSVEVDFSSQDIHADVRGNLTNASKHHVGYGKAEPVNVVAGQPITGLQVSMKSKVAIAYFCFQKGEGVSATPYEGALTLSGDHIYNKMTVNFGVNDFSFSGTKGDISLANTTTHLKYAMLVPTNSTEEEILNFGGGATGSTTLANGIEANKFYRIDGNMPIEVTVKPIEFSVGSGTTVKFAPGNLYYDGTAGKWKFEANQCDFRTYNDGIKEGGSCIGGVYNQNSGTPSGDWGLFGWSGSTASAAYGKDISTSNSDYSGDFKDWGGITDLPDNAGGETWRTLSSAEWAYLLNTDGSSGRMDANRFAKARVNGVCGMLIFPDGYNGGTAINVQEIGGISSLNTITIGYTSYSIPEAKWTSMETAGVVFLPAAGDRNGSAINRVNTYANYWTSTCNDNNSAYRMRIIAASVDTQISANRCNGYSVRLVRSAS